jgi:prepilin-type N-terminal cleavage/methylation domain-containing protein
MLVTTPDTRERGFTLIEMIVALVLCGIVLALMIGAVIGVFGSSNKSSANAKSQKATVAAVEQLTTDLRSARAPERSPRYVGSPDGLRDVLLRGAGPALHSQDLLDARAGRLLMYAEAIASSPREECILWEVRSDGALQRTVYPFSPGCTAVTGPGLQQREVMPAPPAGASAAAAAPAPFSYRMLVQPDPLNPDLDPSDCTTPAPRANLASRLERNQVVGVDLNLRSFVIQRDGRGDQELLSSVSMSARQGMDYRYGIGCVA